MIQLAVFGDPIRHSLSPQIHKYFAEQAGLRVDYKRILTPPEGLGERFAAFVDAGGVGANITLPLKEVALSLADQLDALVVQTGALNTLTLSNGAWRGSNTDGVGLIKDLHRIRGALKGARVLLVGAGGAARGVTPALLAADIRSLHVANRTPERAEQLLHSIFPEGSDPELLKRCSAGSLTTMPRSQFDIIINATATGLHSERPTLPERVLMAKPLCYDMVYGDKPTAFMQWAKGQGCEVSDGLGMLVGQAAESFRLWTEVTPDPDSVLMLLRRQHGLWSAE